MPDGVHDGLGDEEAGSDADRAVTALYRKHYRSLVGLAALLVPDLPVAEHIVQDSFVAMHAVWKRLNDDDRALDYLHRSVVQRARKMRRRGASAHPTPGAGAPQAGAGAPQAAQIRDIRAQWPDVALTLRSLPARQREVLVLRYYVGLSQTQIAAAMSITTRAADRLSAQALSAVQAEIGRAAG